MEYLKETYPGPFCRGWFALMRPTGSVHSSVVRHMGSVLSSVVRHGGSVLSSVVRHAGSIFVLYRNMQVAFSF